MSTTTRKSLRLSKSVESQMNFAYWCIRHQIDPRDGAEIITLCERAAKAVEASCNLTWDDNGKTERRVDRLRGLVEEKCQVLGWTIEQYSIWPTFERKAYGTFHLPN